MEQFLPLTLRNYKRIKIQNDATRFIFNIYGQQKWEPITPFLKKLHFLPVKFRIKFKIALMVFKCINNIAPDYLSSLIMLRNPNRYSVRMDNDYYLLEMNSFANVKRVEGAFSYQAPEVWNNLPYEIRSLNELSKFKIALKTFYFKCAYLHDDNIQSGSTCLG